MMADITINDLTNGTLVNKEWTGTGVFDKLIIAVNGNTEGQRQKGYITGEKYGDVYLGSMQSVIAQSMEFLLREQLTEEQIATEKLGQQALRAKTEDENGMTITEDSIAYSSSPETQHYWAVKTAEEGYEKAGHDTDAAEEGVESIKAANRIAEAKLNLDYNKKVDPTDANVLVNYSTIPTSTALDTTWLDSKIPETNFELALLKARTEAQVATRTAEGYQADTYYKIYRSLQELMFALTNAGVIDSETENGIYSKIVAGMESAMNAQAGVWETGSFNIDLDGSNG